MKKLIVPFVIGGLALLCLALLDGSCRSRREVREWRLKYEGYRAIAVADAKFRDQQIAEARAVIAARNERVGVLEAQAVTLTTRINTLTAALSSAPEPPTTDEQERLPIVIFLRARDKAHEERFSLAVEAIASKDATIAELKGIVVEKDRIIEAVESKYATEHALRLSCEEGLALYAHQARASRLWVVLGKYGPPIALIVGMLISK